MSEALPNHDQNAKGEHCPEQPVQSAPASASVEEIVSHYTDYVLAIAPLYNREELKNYFRQAIQSALAPVQAELSGLANICRGGKCILETEYGKEVERAFATLQSRLTQAEAALTKYKEAWAGYKVFPSFANEKLFDQAGALAGQWVWHFLASDADEAASRDMAQKLEKAQAACREVANFDWGNCGDSIDRIIDLCREAAPKP